VGPAQEEDAKASRKRLDKRMMRMRFFLGRSDLFLQCERNVPASACRGTSLQDWRCSQASPWTATVSAR
jgi:hypothetical protein